MNRLLIIDDDQELCSLLVEFLRREGFTTLICHSAKKALEDYPRLAPDLIILDLMMPDMDGLTFLKKLRQTEQVPVLVLSARGDDIDSIVGLELGADDYLGKPFNTKVLLARIRAMLRRTDSQTMPRDDSRPITVHSGKIVLHRGKRTLTINHQDLPLTSTEFSIAEYLMSAMGLVISKSELFEQVLGRPYEKSDRSLDMHISNLRSKLSNATGSDNIILTIRGTGYQWVKY